ncbi:MAG: type I DNA topoisomerase [Treponemataceae bacterium]|nr:type I DNA topoisomerase [Treponemataceae bacterium]
MASSSVKKKAEKTTEKAGEKAAKSSRVAATKKKTVSKKASAKGDKKTTLVVVESPAKAKTIEKYLGKGYVVKASMGHLIDLPKSRLAIEIDNNFQPEYITVRGRAAILKDLEKEAKKASLVLLASDNDREGEAIAWHLYNDFEQKTNAAVRRIVFNEITPVAIKDAVKHPSDIDENKVNAQKARRVLDRLVGYNLSPLLWKKVKNGLSAGRVQSVALRMICQREREVENFIPEEYWTLNAEFSNGKQKIEAQLALYKNKKPDLKNEGDVNKIIEAIKNESFVITDIKETDRTVKPKAPFTTSKLQQAAATRLGFTSKKTMQLAQQLYEGINIGSSRVGLITYMRTDSVRISKTAIEDVRDWLSSNYPSELPESPVEYAVGNKAQDAHEAIRPTYTKYTPDYVKEFLTRDQHRLYTIIWEAFVSSQMKNAKSRTTSIDIKAGDALFRMTAGKIIDKGFYSVIKLLSPKEETGGYIPDVSTGDLLKTEKFVPEQHFTQGPSRYTDASIVKILEEKGIGRPSTYAPIISVLLERYYVNRSNKQLVPTPLGRMINDILVESFPDVINENFTADVETQLDDVEEGKREWPSMMKDFFFPFKERLDSLMATLESVKGSMDEQTGEICELCGKPMLKKLGRFGYFLACSGFPACHNTKSVPLAKCPRPGCNGKIVARKSKGSNKEFYGCTNYPACDFITYFKPTNSLCPKCGQFMVEKYDKKHGSFKSCINPACNYLHTADDDDPGETEL